MLKVGSKFSTFDELSKRLEEFQELEQVQLWVRDSRTVVAAAKRARRKSLNPDLKYAELTYSCVFGGRRPSDQTKSHNQTSAGGCPFKVRLSTSLDGQALVVKEICHDHNHEPGKKLHEEPRRLYKKTQNRTTVRKPVRYIVNKRVTSSTNKTKSRLDHTESHVQLGQSPFHHLHLHQQQYQQQQQQLKLQLQQHLQQQQQQQQQLRQKQAEVIRLDSPDHIDTPDHLSSPDLSTTFDQLGSLNNSVDQYTYLPPSPISPSLSSGCPVDFEEEEDRFEPILDLEEALEEALGDLDSVGSMEVDANLRLTSTGSTAPSLVLHSEISSTDDHTDPPPAKRQRGRPRKQSFTGTSPKGEKIERDHSGEPKDGGNSSKQEEDFLGFSPSSDKGKSDVMISRADVAQANAMARQLHVFKPGIDFVPGARLEVLESRDNNWYQCKIVEVDWGELDILVHYERWSNRFDEWLKMDSTRIRPLIRSSQRKDKRNGQFRIGDRVTARWAADGKRYQARVVKILGDEQYEVLFFDGVTKVVRSGALTKFETKPPGTGETGEEGESASSSCSPSKQSGPDDDEMMLLSPAATTASSTDSRSSSPEPDQHSLDSIKEEELPEVEAVTTPIKKSIFDVEIIDQKRKPKRKAAVEELFQSLKKKRKYEHHGKKEDSPTSPKYPQTSRVASSSPRHQPPIRSTQVRKAPASRKRSRDSACVAEEEGPMLKQTESLFPTQAPESTSSTCDTPAQSHPSNLVMVELDSGWKKCCTRRTHGTTAGKWDMFYIAPEGKKIRCKNDLLRYCEETGQSYDLDKFDFSVKNMKDAIEAYLQETEPKEMASHPPKEQKETSKDADVIKIKEEKIDQEEKTGTSELAENIKAPATKKSEVKKPETKRLDVKLSDSPRIKIEIPILPKTETIGTLSSVQSSSASPWSPTMPLALPRSLPASATTYSAVEAIKEEPPSVEVDPAIVSDSGVESSKPGFTPPARQKHMIKKDPVLAPNEFVVRAEHNEHQCPKEGCGKGFRKENLLQMHIKHYHPEILKKSSSWAPNVADLAYARTVGDHLDLNSSPTPSSPPVDKALKQEGSSKKLSRGVVSGSSSDARSKIGEKKPQGPSKGASTSKDTKKKDSCKVEPETTKTNSEEELNIKEEIDDYIDDLEEDTPVVRDVEHTEDPDYVPCEGEIVQKKKDRKDKRKTRGDSKGKKRKSVPSESMSEDDLQETKAVTKYRYSKRKGSATPKINISATNDTFAPEANVSTSPVKKVQCSEETSNLEVEEDTTDTWAEGAESASVQETSAEIINCGCGSTEEEGLMLQCDVCLCWQHGACYNIVGEDQVPDKYICSLCDHPKLERSSHKFRHHQDWLKEGRLPRFSFSRTRGDARLEACVRRGHEMTANVLQLSQVLHSLRLKLHIAKEADHPKFVMWHKKWDEREENSDQGKVSSAAANADAVAAPPDLMNIVEQNGSNSMMTDPSLITGEMNSSSVPDTTNVSSVKQSVKSHPSGVWDVTEQIINMEQFSTQANFQKGGNASLLQKEPNNDDIKPINYKLEVKEEVIKEDNAMENNSSSETTVSLKMSDTKKHISIDHAVLDVKQEEVSVSSKVNNVAVADTQQSTEVDEHTDMSNVFSDKSDVENVSKIGTNIKLMKENTKNSEPQIESSDTFISVGEDKDLTNTKEILQTNLKSAELERENKIDSKSTKELDDLESNKEIENSKITDRKQRTAENDQVTGVDISTSTPLHEGQSAIDPEQYSQKPASVKSVNIEETSQEDSYSDDSAHPEDCACEEMDSQVEEIKGEVIFKTEKIVDSSPSLAKKFKANIDSEGDETKTTQNEEKHRKNQRESKDVGIMVKEEINAKQNMLEENSETIVEKSEADINKGEIEIKSTYNEGKAEVEIHEVINSTITHIKDLPENKVKGENANEENGNTHPEVMSDPPKYLCISEQNKDSEQNLTDARDKVKSAHFMEDGETQVKGMTEEAVLEAKELTEEAVLEAKKLTKEAVLEAKELTKEAVLEAKELTEEAVLEAKELTKEAVLEVKELDYTKQSEVSQSKALESLELPQPLVMGSTDLPQPDDMEGTEDALEDDDTQLDDDGDLALDLGGLGAAGEGGMPGGSDLAALLSSHSELEQLATQASSALAPHVPTSSIVQPVPAPIIPETERIEPVNCKLNLLEHVQIVQTNITKRFDQIEKQLEVLEAEMGLCADTADDDGEEDSEERDPATLQARALIKLILNDVNVVKKIAEFTH